MCFPLKGHNILFLFQGKIKHELVFLMCSRIRLFFKILQEKFDLKVVQIHGLCFLL